MYLLYVPLLILLLTVDVIVPNLKNYFRNGCSGQVIEWSVLKREYSKTRSKQQQKQTILKFPFYIKNVKRYDNKP